MNEEFEASISLLHSTAKTWSRCIDFSPLGFSSKMVVRIHKSVFVRNGEWSEATVRFDNYDLDSTSESITDLDKIQILAITIKMACRIARNLDKLIPPGTKAPQGTYPNSDGWKE